MTLVGLREEDSSRLPMMLSVQHHGGIQLTNSVTGTQGHHHHHHHHHHRGNVIVTASSAPGSDGKTTHGCKRSKMYTQATPYGAVPHQPASVAKRNARERNRVKQVNNGFATLRQHIPQSVAQALGGNTAGTGGSRAGSKKLSKVETLRMAVEYIRSLQRLLDEHDGSDATGSTASGSHTDLISETGIGGGGGGGAGHRLASSGADLHRHLSRPTASPGGTTAFAPPPCSEASSSPTPSFVSETSSAGSQGYGTASGGTLYAPHSDAYDNYEPMSPEDEELLDVISWWQQSQ